MDNVKEEGEVRANKIGRKAREAILGKEGRGGERREIKRVL